MSTISFIGAGNMAEAIARGLLRAGIYSLKDIYASDPSPERREIFQKELGITCATDSKTVAAKGDIVILAVKPFVMAEVLEQIAPDLNPDALLISIAAGISCKFIEGTLGGGGEDGLRVVRVMPNTPMLAGKGMSAVAKGTHATDHDLEIAERIFASAGKVVRVDESAIDAVTAVSGSGPAYVFYFTEVLMEAGRAAGLNETQAALLARETVIGAAALLDQSQDTPAELRRKVTTPKGTTQAAIESMQANDLAGLLRKAVAAAAQRSQELGK